MARTRHRRAPAGGFGWPLAQGVGPCPDAGTEPAGPSGCVGSNGRYREVAQRAPLDPRFLEVGVARLVEDDEIGVVGVHQDWGRRNPPCLVNPRPRKDSQARGERTFPVCGVYLPFPRYHNLPPQRRPPKEDAHHGDSLDHGALTYLAPGIASGLPDRTQAATTPFTVGATIPKDIALTDINGKTHTLGDYRGKVVFIHFWSIVCPYEKQAEPKSASTCRRRSPTRASSRLPSTPTRAG